MLARRLRKEKVAEMKRTTGMGEGGLEEGELREREGREKVL